MGGGFLIQTRPDFVSLQRLVVRRVLSGRATKLPDAAGWSRHREVIRSLQVQPELGSRIERLRQEPGGLGCHAPLSPDELVHPLNGYAQVFGKSYLGLAQGLEEFVTKNLARMRRSSLFRFHVHPVW